MEKILGNFFPRIDAFLSPINLIILQIFTYVYVGLCEYGLSVCKCLRRHKLDTGHDATEVTDGCDLPDEDAGNRLDPLEEHLVIFTTESSPPLLLV